MTLLKSLFILSIAFFCGGAHAESISHGRFKDVAIYRPSGEIKQFVLFLSDHRGWIEPAPRFAAELAKEGALVAGINLPQLLRDFDRDDDPCVFPDGDLENLSHFVQAYYKVPTYLTPILAGYASGGSLAYATASKTQPGIFSGAMSIGSCAKLDMKKPLCHGGRVLNQCPVSDPKVPWVSLQAADIGPHLKGALARITGGRSERLPPPPKSLADLPVIEVPETVQGSNDTFAVLWSGDGGWAGLDREVAAALAARGIPVAGLDSLRYFWTARTPDSMARDLDRMLRYYASQWNRSHVIVIGYSQGADVMPFAVSRLPSTTRSMVDLTTLLGLGRNAQFEFHLTNWISDGRNGVPIEPELAKLPAKDVLCLYGEDDDDSICPELKPSQARVQQMPGGHHFDGEYERVARMIIDQARY
jgi:type IV secretory pathway VirJ component